MKTIITPIYNGIRARNFFRTDTYRELVKDQNIRLVVVVPSAKVEYYKKEYPESNVVFEPLDILGETAWGKNLNVAAINLLNTNTIRLKQVLAYYKHKSKLKLAFWRIFNRLLSPLPFTMSVVRLLDKLEPTDPQVAALLTKYKPDLVVIPDIVFPVDRIFIRAAKRAGFYTLGMVRSWDNLTSKGVVQILPDKLIVHNSTMKEEAIKLAGMPARDIYVSGPPQFDWHFRTRNMSREEFMKSLNIPADRKLVLCAPFFNDYVKSSVNIINTLTDAVNNGRLPKDIHFIIRYRPTNAEIPVGMLKPSEHYTITRPCEARFIVVNEQSPVEDYEHSQADVELLMNSLAYSDVVINTISTLSVDAAAMDKPVINVRYDGDPNVPPKYGVKIFYHGHDHYEMIERSGGVRLAWTPDELIDQINMYLKDASIDRDGRRRIVAEQLEYTDGLSGKRAADAIRKYLYR
jgi:CDP-glycerol glycerophosphotransferase (TagB/SpsB family)